MKFINQKKLKIIVRSEKRNKNMIFSNLDLELLNFYLYLMLYYIFIVQ
jgi:hypothetical protein